MLPLFCLPSKVEQAAPLVARSVMFRDTIEALRIGQSPVLALLVIFLSNARSVLRLTMKLPIRLNITPHRLAVPALLLFLICCAANAAMSQGQAAKPQKSPAPAAPGARVTETLIDAGISDDPAVDQMVAVYSPKVRELETVIGKLKGELKKGPVGAG